MAHGAHGGPQQGVLDADTAGISKRTGEDETWVLKVVTN